MAEFKDMLKYYRKREGLSQADFAKAIGLSASTISMYEVGEREPSFEIEEKIADYFNVDLNTLRGKDSENTTSEDYEISKFANIMRQLSPAKRREVFNYMNYIKGKE